MFVFCSFFFDRCHLFFLSAVRKEETVNLLLSICCPSPKYLTQNSPKSKKTPDFLRNRVFFGGDKRDRTADLLNAIQALSQLSYTPIFLPCRSRLLYYSTAFKNVKHLFWIFSFSFLSLFFSQKNAFPFPFLPESCIMIVSMFWPAGDTK